MVLITWIEFTLGLYRVNGVRWLIVLLISVNFWGVFVFVLTQLRNSESLGVHVLDVPTAYKIDVPALSSCINWPNCLIEQCSTTLRCFIPTLSCTVVIYYPLLYNLAHFGICSDELHQRSVKVFLFSLGDCILIWKLTSIIFTTQPNSQDESWELFA